MVHIVWLCRGKSLIPLGFSLLFPLWWMIDEREWYSKIARMIWYTILFSCSVLLWDLYVHVHDVYICGWWFCWIKGAKSIIKWVKLYVNGWIIYFWMLNVISLDDVVRFKVVGCESEVLFEIHCRKCRFCFWFRVTGATLITPYSPSFWRHWRTPAAWRVDHHGS